MVELKLQSQYSGKMLARLTINGVQNSQSPRTPYTVEPNIKKNTIITEIMPIIFINDQENPETDQIIQSNNLTSYFMYKVKEKQIIVTTKQKY